MMMPYDDTTVQKEGLAVCGAITSLFINIIEFRID